jgi:hypothetical protein
MGLQISITFLKFFKFWGVSNVPEKGNGKKDIVIGNKIKLGKKNSMEKKMFILAKQKIGKTIYISFIYIYIYIYIIP